MSGTSATTGPSRRPFTKELLLNLVRLKYRETPEFVDIGGVAAQYNFEASANANGKFFDFIDNFRGIGFGGSLALGRASHDHLRTASRQGLRDPAHHPGQHADDRVDGEQGLERRPHHEGGGPFHQPGRERDEDRGRPHARAQARVRVVPARHGPVAAVAGYAEHRVRRGRARKSGSKCRSPSGSSTAPSCSTRSTRDTASIGTGIRWCSSGPRRITSWPSTRTSWSLRRSTS